MKKILSLIIILNLCFSSLIYAENSNYNSQINLVVSKINKIMQNKDFNKIFIYISLLEQRKTNSNLNTNLFINNVILVLKKQYYRNSNNLILRLDKNYNHKNIDKIIINNKNQIINSDNIFIFKNNATGKFSADNMLYSANKLKKINPKIRIFVDQEGGVVNRFNDFDKINTFNKYISSNLSLKFKYAILDNNTKSLIKEAFKDKTTFISMDSIGEIYYSINKNNTIEKNRFLDFITFFRLYILHKNGINTHGLVCDLDKGNPIISGYDRSFSDNIDHYISLGRYFVKNAKILGISLYLKHFPGHGRGQTDTHKGILEYSNNAFDKAYILDNMRVFEAIIYEAEKSGVEIGLMSAHVLLPENIKSKYLNILNKADYIMTDDLGMGAYNALKNKKFKNKFFSTNEFINNENTIKVYTKENEIK